MRPYEMEAAEHPGREPWELGISTIAWDPERIYDRLQGDEPEDDESGSMTKGSILHEHLLDGAPHNEMWVRFNVPETHYWFGGHVDWYSGEKAILGDLKTSDAYEPKPDWVEDWKLQVGLLGEAIEHGQVCVGWCPGCSQQFFVTAHHQVEEEHTCECGLTSPLADIEPEWLPASKFFPNGVERLVVDFWGARMAGPMREVDLEGDEVVHQIDEAREWAVQQVQAMIDGDWDPSQAETPTPDGQHEDPDPLPPDLFQTLMKKTREARVTEKQAGSLYQSRREELQDRWPDEDVTEYEIPGAKVTRYPEETEEVFDVDTALDLVENPEGFREYQVNVDGLRRHEAEALEMLLGEDRVRTSSSLQETELEEHLKMAEDLEVPTKTEVTSSESIRFSVSEIEE